MLLDVDRIAPCLPGATLASRDGDACTGKGTVGPINLTDGGNATSVSVDDATGVVVIEATGRQTRGTGTAKATVSCTLVETDGMTRVDVDTDLAITGNARQRCCPRAAGQALRCWSGAAPLTSAPLTSVPLTPVPAARCVLSKASAGRAFRANHPASSASSPACSTPPRTTAWNAMKNDAAPPREA